jgi:hypothetical protein
MSPDGVSYIPRQFTSIMRSFVLLVLKRFWFSMFYHLHFGLFFVCCCNLLVTVMFGMGKLVNWGEPCSGLPVGIW